MFLSLAVVVASVSAAPRYIVLPIEDVDLSALVGQTLPVYRMPGLMRQARQVEDELDSFQMAPRRDSEPAGSNAYAAPHAAPLRGRSSAWGPKAHCCSTSACQKLRSA